MAGLAHTLKQPVTEDDWSRGPAEAPVTLVEYADFECPDCQRSHPVIERVVESLGEKVQLVFRQFPLVSLHPHAQQAALASEAAGRQGKFWEMQGRLMEARGALGTEDLMGYARELGLGSERVKRDMADPALRDRIRKAKLLGVRSGVNGTPTLFINGVRFEGEREPVGEGELRGAIEAALGYAR